MDNISTKNNLTEFQLEQIKKTQELESKLAQHITIFEMMKNTENAKKINAIIKLRDEQIYFIKNGRK